MTLYSESSFNLSKLPLSPKVTALETSLQESLVNFKELMIAFEQMFIETETYKTQLLTQKEKCQSKTCSSSEALKKVIAAKDNIIGEVASNIIILNETKNFKCLEHILKIVCNDSNTSTPPSNTKDNRCKINTEVVCTPDLSKGKNKLLSPKKELNNSIEDVPYKDESISEIEGTPTGRKSPIIPSKKYRGVISLSSTETREKKKCPDNWPTPEKKSVKIHFPRANSCTPRKGRVVQTRLQVFKEKVTTVVDLTSSPELSGGSGEAAIEKMNDVQKLIKKESSENDDTILPSPTSGPKNFLLSRNSCKDKADKFKRPQLSLKQKTEHTNSFTSQHNLDSKILENKLAVVEAIEMEESINILNTNRFLRIPKIEARVKQEADENETHYDSDESISLLQHVQQLQNNNDYHGKSQILPHRSPAKRPLVENMNATNLPPQHCIEPRMSLPRGVSAAAVEDRAKRKTPEKVEPVYKEPTVRKKAEKQALPAWVCSECRTFYSELYRDDPDALSKVVDKCGKHRGRRDPTRPRTPDGIWDPRWSVPRDTEEFNRRNNAL